MTTVKSSKPGDGAVALARLKDLTHDEILEVLSQGFCRNCEAQLEERIHNLSLNKKVSELSLLDKNRQKPSSESSVPRPSQQYSVTSSSPGTPGSVNSKQNVSTTHYGSEILLNDGLSSKVSSIIDNGLSEEQKERIRFSQVGRKKDFVHMERINGKSTNVLQGLELHTKVFNAEEQKKIVESIYELQRMGRKGQLRERTYTEPRKWMRGKGRVTIQFGCCYNYAVDKNGNPPGIIRGEEVDPLPLLFKQMIKRLVKWHVLPPTAVPNSCIVNLYDEGDCIPPHIDHHDFVRPFCTVSFLTECNILFGTNLKVEGPGEFSGPAPIPLPVGSVLILKGNGADIAKHCVPAVPAKRISVTFRKMDDSKLPYRFSPDPDLVGIKPLVISPMNQKLTVAQSPVQQTQHQNGTDKRPETARTVKKNTIFNAPDDFPPLGAVKSVSRR